ncbi:MAG: response regulator [Nitrospira sp.]|nr:MAG: response regulator [Nitrospira sp.]
MHPLLRRQLKRLGLDPTNCPADLAGWQAMLDRVSQSYVENDQGRALLEQSLDVTSREMQGLYEDLRRSGETELAEERTKLEAVLHSLGDGLCVVDPQWKIVLMNPQAEDLFGMALTTLMGQPVYHFLSPGPEEFSEECLITDTSIPPLEQGIAFRTDDGILLRVDGHMMPISLVVTPVSTQGVVNGAVLVFRDVTAQKRAAEQRTESAALLHRMQTGLLELATNADLYRGERSDAFHVITRVASQSLRVARASIWFFTDAHAAIRCADLFEQATETYTSGIELPATGFPRYFAALATEDVIVANQAQTDPKTSEFAASYLIPLGITSMLDVPIWAKGKMVGVICHEHIGPARTWTAEEQQFATSVANTVSLVLEAADRRKAEQALRDLSIFQRAMLDNAGHAIISATPDGIIRLFNPAAESLLGYRADELIGKQTPAVFHDLEEVSARARLFSAELGVPIEPGFDVFVEKSRRGLPNEHEWTYIRKDGTRLTVLLNVTALQNVEGQITSFLGIASDITSLKIVERELISAKEAAEAASIAKSQFLANMSHEIRTPMNGVLGLAALLGQTPLSPKQQRLTNTIMRSGNSLLDIINDILDFSKIEAGKLELEHTDFHLRMLVDDVLELFAAPAHQKHLELIADVADSVPAFVKGDPARLRQILINLIGNAIKFTAQGEVVVSIVCIAEGEDQSVLCFSVKDSGIGITPDALRSIFQPFAQADGSTTRKYGGTGLGLAIAKQLVAFMGGEIWAESQMGSGANFLFTVHLAHSHRGSTGALDSKLALPNQRVLVVDDSPTARLSLDRQLRRWGLTSAVAESGPAAVQLLATALEDGLPYDTIVLDLDMPGMSGLETVHAIRDTLRHHHPRVILLTPVERVDAEEDHTSLIAATLTKPVRPSDLHRALSGQTVLVSSSPHHAEQEERTPAKPQGSILLAEDNAVNQEVTLGMLEVLGCTATAVENGRRAIELLASQPFSVILMDCQMPEMDGFEATRAIRLQEQDSGRRIPIVALTAHALQGDRELCLAAGMDDYLSKPFTIEQLKTVLYRWLQSTSQPTEANSPQAPVAPSLASTLQSDQSPVDPKSWDSITSLQRPGQPDLLAKVIGLYLKDSQGLVDKVLAAAAGKDFATLRDSAHSLKSRSATLGAWHVADLCKQLETGAREQTLAWIDAERLGRQLQQTFTATCDIFEIERQRRAA